MGIAESTFRNRLGRENLTPNDIEKIAEFFGKTIAYYFDKDETEAPKATAECKKCIEKDKELEEKDAEILRLRLKLCEIQEKYTALLEELNGRREKQQECG
jgi:transcriptional regulator with XRE-family HTH domain